MRKKLFSILLSLAMVVTMMPAMTMTAFASPEYLVYVSGTPIVDNVASDVFGDGTVKFTPAEGTANAKLTLNNATTLTRINYLGNETLDIEVSGDSTIAPSDGRFGIITWKGGGDVAENQDASLRIFGNGTLTIDLTSADATERKNGIFVNKNLTIEDVTLKVNIGDTVTNNHGIHAENDITIDGAKVTSTVGSSVENTTKPICAYNDLIIKGGADVTAVAGKSSADGSYAIYASNDAKISGSTTKVNATSGQGVNSCAILAGNAVTITDGKITAKAGTGEFVSAISTTEDGKTPGTLTIGDSDNVAAITGAKEITKGDGVISKGYIVQSGTDPVEITFQHLTRWAALQEAINSSETNSATKTVMDNKGTSIFTVQDVDGTRSIKLLADIIASGEPEAFCVSGDAIIELDLNGHEINAKKLGDSDRAMEVYGKLTIKDSTDTKKDGSGTGKITGGILLPTDGLRDGGGILVQETGELVLNSGSICDNFSSSDKLGGGGVAVFGKFTMNGGSICKNKARWGGGIGLDEDSEFIMKGGRIYENESMMMDGSAINMFSGKSHDGSNTTNLLGGQIYNNKSNNTTDDVNSEPSANGICAAGSAVWIEGKIILGGTIQIYDNYQGYFDWSTGTWSNLTTKDANLGIVDVSDDAAGRYTVKISSTDSLRSPANIHLSKTSERHRITPIGLGENLANYGLTGIFANGNNKFFLVDVRDNDAYGVSSDGTVIAKPTSNGGGTVIEETSIPIMDDKVVIAKIDNPTISKDGVTPEIKIECDGKLLVENVDYTVEYIGKLDEVGTVTAVIKGIGKYSGETTVTFDVLPKNTKISSLKKGKKSFTIKVAKQSKSKVNGYKVRYSVKKSMSGSTTRTIGKKYNKTSLTVKKLKSKKTYYVQIKTYKTVNGKNYYSKWSDTKKVKTK